MIVLLSGKEGRYHCSKGYRHNGVWYLRLPKKDAAIAFVTHWTPKLDYPQEPVKEWLMSGVEHDS